MLPYSCVSQSASSSFLFHIALQCFLSGLALPYLSPFEVLCHLLCPALYPVPQVIMPFALSFSALCPALLFVLPLYFPALSCPALPSPSLSCLDYPTAPHLCCHALCSVIHHLPLHSTLPWPLTSTLCCLFCPDLPYPCYALSLLPPLSLFLPLPCHTLPCPIL